MIVGMEKLYIACQSEHMDEILNALRDAGVLHILPLKDIDGKSGEELANEANRLGIIRNSLKELYDRAKAKPVATSKLLDELIATADSLLHKRNVAVESIEELTIEKQDAEVLGDFRPETVEELKRKGMHISFHRVANRALLPDIKDAVLHVTSESKGAVYFVIIATMPVECSAMSAPVPEHSLSDISTMIASLNSELYETDKALLDISADYGRIDVRIAHLNEKYEFAQARAAMSNSGTISYICGFCPNNRMTRIHELCKEKGAAMMTTEPDENDRIPTLIESPSWIKPISSVFDVIGILPGYREIDISSVFMVFFSIFFAMLVGDAGYGLIFILLTILAQWKMKSAPKKIFVLMYILNICTVIWGVLTGTYFGIQHLPSALTGLRIEWLMEEKNVMALSFFIGAVHLTIAHIWNAVRIINSIKVLAQIGWICVTWGMFFLAKTMVIGAESPGFLVPLLCIGVLLVFLFMATIRELKTEWPNHVMLPLSVVSNFVDIVSYLRLFAVGSASLAMAIAFNEMAMRIGFGSIGAGLGAAIILFIGHALNIILAAMAVLVHGVRLNTLEFSSHIGLSWAGTKYSPFCRTDAIIEKS